MNTEIGKRKISSSVALILSCVLFAFAVALAVCRVPVMPVAIGIYLPVGLSVAMFAGGLLRVVAKRRLVAKDNAEAGGEDTGTLFSAGLVAGEGLCGIILAGLSLAFR